MTITRTLRALLSLRSLPIAALGAAMALLLAAPQSADATVKLLHSGPGGLDVEIVTPLAADTVKSGSPSVVRLSAADWPSERIPGEPVTPYLVIPISVPPEGSVHAMIVSRQDTSAVFGSIEVAVDEVPIGAEDIPHFPSASAELSGLPGGEVAVEVIGMAADVRVARLIVRPVRVTGETVAWAQRMQVAVRFSTPTSKASRAGGTATRNHPAGFTVNADQIGAFQSPRMSDIAARPAASGGLLPDLLRQRRLQLYVIHEGIYRITGDDLAEWLIGTDVDVESIDPRTFRLYQRGREVPIYVEREDRNRVDHNTAIEFYGKPNRQRYQHLAPDAYNDPYVVPSIYLLTWGGSPGARMADKDVSVQFAGEPWVTVPRTYTHTLHFERDATKMHYHGDMYGDRHFWQTLSTGQSAQFDLDIPFPAPGTRPVLTAMARGVNNARHYVEYRLQGTRLLTLGAGDQVFRDQDLIYGTSSGVTEVELVHGRNVLDAIVGAPGSTASDVIALNWFQITYDRLYQTESDQIFFRRPAEPDTGHFEFTISGFSTPGVSVYKAGVSRLVGYRTTRLPGGDEGTGFQLRFQDHIDGDDPLYIAVTDDRKLKPFRADLLEPWTYSLKNTSRAGDYLMIVHPALMDTAMVLANYRASPEGGGYSVAVVDVRQIYDEFDSGYPTANAVHDFLQYAYDWWQVPPRYVAIIGNAIERFSEQDLSRRQALIPIPVVRVFRADVSGSDHPLSLVSGDDIIPDIFVSRIPAPDNISLSRAIRKTIRFEQDPVRSDWRKSAAMVAGMSHAGLDFVGQIEFIARSLPKRYSIRKFFSTNDPNEPRPFFGRKTQFIEQTNKGALWTIYIGHAGGGVWDWNGLLRPGDADILINNPGKAGIFLSMTCFTGAFNSPSTSSLSETMLFAPNGGAIAWLGATGVGYYFNDFFLAQSLVSAGISNPSRQTTIGEIIAAGKTDYLLRYSGPKPGPTAYTHALLHKFNLTGDPALSVSPPDPAMSLTPETRTPIHGQTISVTGTAGSSVNGTASLAVFDDRDSTVTTVNNLTMQAGTFTTNIAIPDAIYGTGLNVKAYAATQDADWTGYVRLAVAESLIDSVTVSGSGRDSVYVSANIYDMNGIQSVFLNARLDAGGSVDRVGMIPLDGDTNRYRTARPLNLDRLPLDAAVVVDLVIEVTDMNGVVTRETNIPPLYPNRESRISIVDVTLSGTAHAELAVTIENTGAGASDSTLVAVWLVEGTDTTLVRSVTGTPLSPQASPGTIGPEIVIDGSSKTAGSSSVTTDDDLIRSAAALRPQSTIIRVPLPDTLFQGISPGADLLVTAGTVVTARAAHTRYTVPPNWGVFHPLRARLVTLKTPSGRYSATIEPGALSDSTVVTIDEVDLPAKLGQPDISAPDRSALHVEWRGPATMTSDGELMLTFVPDTTISAIQQGRHDDRLWIGHWNEDSSQWEVIPRDRHVWTDNRDTLRAPTLYPGTYGLVVVDDNTPPAISVSVSRQTFSDGAFVGENPRFMITIEDRNGVSTRQNDIEVYVDETALADSAIVIPGDRASTTAITVTATPPALMRREAEYRLRVVARDAVGNEGEYEAGFRIARTDEPLMQFLGTFPNPFGEAGTVFAFEFSDQMEDVRVSIYDVAGRKVLDFSNFDLSQLRPNEPPESNIDPEGIRLSDDTGEGRLLVAPGYHELHWMGTDRHGVKIANGVYFGIMTVRNLDGRTQKETFTMVKAE